MLKEEISAILGFPVENWDSDFEKINKQGKLDVKTLALMIRVVCKSVEEIENKLEKVTPKKNERKADLPI